MLQYKKRLFCVERKKMQKEWKYSHKPIWETSKYSYCNRHRKEFEKAKEIEEQEIEEEIEKTQKQKNIVHIDDDIIVIPVW